MSKLWIGLVALFALGCVSSTSNHGTTPNNVPNPDANRVAAPM